MITKAVIPAAGFGTRFLPFAKAVPKEMIPLIDKPVIQYVVEEAVGAGITDILIVVSRGKTAIHDHFNADQALEARLAASGRHELLAELQRINHLANLHYTYQQELNGLGDAVMHARSFVGNEPFAVLLGDTVVTSETRPALTQLINAYEQTSSSVVALEAVPQEKTSRYGIIDGVSEDGRLYKINALVEKPHPDKAPSNLAIAGRYVFTPGIFDALGATPPGKGNEIQLTDAMRLLLTTNSFYGFRFDGKRHDIGDKFDFIRATLEFALKHPEFRDRLRDFLETIPPR